MLEINNISKIGVISDTHLDKYSGHIPKTVMDKFKGVQLIIHCGDVVSMEALNELETLAPVVAVKGNMDPENLNLPRALELLINGKHTVCVAHGSGSPFGILHRLHKEFEPCKPSIILFGHTHIAGEYKHNDTRLFNPGSPNTRAEYYSIGMLDFTGDELNANVIRL